jgi:tyrosyl-tRNA synthetase
MVSRLPKIEDASVQPITYVNNLDFYKDMNMLSFLRDIGKHFRVNTMLSRDSVK